MRNHEEQHAASCQTKPIPLVDQVTTEPRQAEHYLVRSQKMEAIGQLAAGVAHDFNNLLTVIHAHASLHLADAQLDKEVLESLRQISLAAERASELTRRLLSFSRKQAERVQTLDLGRLLARTEPVLRRILGDSVELTFIRPAKLPPVLGDGAAIEQIITDLVINAREALTEGGRIAVAVEVLSLTAEAVRGNPEARPGCFVALSVIDNGCGIPPELLSRICEPFFTTKPVGNGTGLGLSTVYALVRQHQGWMEVTSAPSQGTTIRIHLPAMTQTSRGPSHTTLFIKRQSGTQGREIILIVEDDLVLRSLAAQTLRRQGYRILEAGNAREAVQVWEQSDRAIDLLLADVILPGGASGVELARELQSRSRTLRTVFTTGHSTELMREDLILMTGINLLHKPYGVQQLIETVRRCLDAVEVATGTAVSDAYQPFAEVPRPVLELAGRPSSDADESATEVAPASCAERPAAVAP